MKKKYTIYATSVYVDLDEIVKDEKAIWSLERLNNIEYWTVVFDEKDKQHQMSAELDKFEYENPNFHIQCAIAI